MRFAGKSHRHSDLYSEPCQTFTIGHFVKNVDGFHSLTISTTRAILEVRQGSEYASGVSRCCSNVIWFRLAEAEGVLEKSYFEIFRKIHSGAPVMECFLVMLEATRMQLYLKRTPIQVLFCEF